MFAQFGEEFQFSPPYGDGTTVAKYFRSLYLGFRPLTGMVQYRLIGFNNRK